MGWAIFEIAGDTSSSGSTSCWIRTDRSDYPSDIHNTRPKGLIDVICKKCGETFETFRKKQQICLKCKKLKKVGQKTGR